MTLTNTERLRGASRNLPYKILLGLCLAGGLSAIAFNITDNRTTEDMYRVCFKPEHPIKDKKYCTGEQRYWVPGQVVRNWKAKDPEFYGKLTRLEYHPAESSKVPYGLTAIACGFSLVGLGAARLNLINKLAPGYRKEVQALWYRQSVAHEVQMAADTIAGNQTVQQIQFAAEVNLGRYQSQFLQPHEIEAAWIEGAEEAAQINPNPSSQPQLTGTHSLDSVTNPKDKVNGAHQSQVTPGQDIHPSVTDALKAIIAIARSDGSTALCGDPGTGKSSLTDAYIRAVTSQFPDSDIRVLSIKNDSFCGLRSAGKLTRFESKSPENAVSLLAEIKAEYDRRVGLEQGERESLPPLILLLDDWLAIAAELDKLQAAGALVFDYSGLLFNILIIGREFNIKWFANIHSLNLSAIGIKELDSNTRGCLNLILLGNRYIKDDREIDAYKIIEQALTTKQVIPDAKDREELKAQYLELKEVSRLNFRPLALIYAGFYRLAILPKITRGTQPKAQPKTGTSQQSLEDLWKRSPDYVMAEFVDSSPKDTEHDAFTDLTKIQQLILTYLNGKGTKSVRDIRSTRALKDYSTDNIRDAINDLVLLKLVIAMGKDEYRIAE